MNTDGALSLLVEGALKGTVVLLVAAVIALVLRRSSAAVRHIVWTSGIAALLLVAPLSRVLPPWRVPAKAALSFMSEASPPQESVRPPVPVEKTLSGPATLPGGARLPESASAAAEQIPSRSTFAGILKWIVPIWVTVAACFAAWFLSGAMRLRRTLSAAKPVDDDRIAELAEAAARDLGVSRSRFRLRWTDHALTPMTWGMRRPFILLPAVCASWPDERLRQVLVHEIGHVQRRDVITQALSSLACIVYWFNPVVWWAARQMLVERERACDDLVLKAGAAPSTYAHELLEIARSLGAGWTTSRVSTAMARKSQISGRLLAVLDAKRSRGSAQRPAVVAGTLLSLALLLSAASLSLSPRPEQIGEQTQISSVATPGIAPAIEPAANLDEARVAIVAAGERAWLQALKRRDAQTMARFYTRDALLVSSHLTARGRRAVQDAMQQMIDRGVTEVEAQTLELHPVGDMVCQVGRVTFRQATGQEVGNSSFMTLWKKEDGEWRIHRDFVTP